MTKATIPGTNTTCGQTGVACYGYDRNGNRTTKQVNATTTTYTYHPTDEIETQTISGVTKTFTYNLFGSQTTAFDAANAMTTSAYDTAERLLTVTPPTGGAATYTYDALGRIATKTIGASVDTYSYLGSTETAWQIANAGGTGFTTKSALDATGARTAVTGNALTGYTGFDLHGNTALAENAAKVITDALRYDAWGELIASTTSALPTPWRYQGRLDVGPDTANPLYDFGARDYRPVTGAFTSLDAYAGQAIDPLSMNRFLYAEANPATFVDPDGHCIRWQDDVCADHKNTAAQQQAVAAQHAKDVAARAAEDRETAHIKTSVGGATQTTTIQRLPNGLFIDIDGTLVDPAQYAQLAGACTAAGRPSGSFAAGPCGAWWKAADKLAASTDGSGPFLSAVPLALVAEFFKKYGDDLAIDSASNLRTSYVQMSRAMFEGAGIGGGVRYNLSVWQGAAGRLASFAGKGLFAVSVIVEAGGGFGEQLANDAGRNLDPTVRVARAAARGAAKAGAGVGGAIAGSFVAGMICEGTSLGLGTPGCFALTVGLAGLGGSAGSGIAGAVTDFGFEWTDR